MFHINVRKENPIHPSKVSDIRSNVCETIGATKRETPVANHESFIKSFQQ